MRTKACELKGVPVLEKSNKMFVIDEFNLDEEFLRQPTRMAIVPEAVPMATRHALFLGGVAEACKARHAVLKTLRDLSDDELSAIFGRPTVVRLPDVRLTCSFNIDKGVLGIALSKLSKYGWANFALSRMGEDVAVTFWR